MVAACAIALVNCARVASANAPQADPPTPDQAPAAAPDAEVPQPPEAQDTAPSETPEAESDESREAEVTLSDGRRVSGILVERTADRVVLRINNITTSYSAKDVTDVVVQPPLSARYAEMRKLLADTDLDSRLRLAEWLRARGAYSLALEEVNSILQSDPDSPEARQLRTWLAGQIKMDAKARKPVADGKAPAIRLASAPKAEFPVLTPEQINTIRVYEIDLADPPRMIIDRETVTALIDRYSKDELIPRTLEGRESLYRKRPDQILDLMYRLRARDMYNRVRVLEDPKAFRLFRDKVHGGWLMNACASTQCHGGEDAGRLWLTTRRPNSDATVYTNFLILDQYRIQPPANAAGTGEQPKAIPLIDYESPENSVLLQMALIGKESQFPHPRVTAAPRSKNFVPIFHSRDDRRFLETVAWIKSMYRPRPEYPVDYAPPTPAGARPATASGPGAPNAPAPR